MQNSFSQPAASDDVEELVQQKTALEGKLQKVKARNVQYKFPSLHEDHNR